MEAAGALDAEGVGKQKQHGTDSATRASSGAGNSTAKHDLDLHRREEENNGDEDEDEDEDDGEEWEEEGEENEDEEEGDDEPLFKYASLTKSVTSIYRNGDSTSCFLTAGDKMIVGTHNGNIHVFSIPSFQVLRVYHAHSASVTSISISPFPPPLAAAISDAASTATPEEHGHATKLPGDSSKSPKNPRQMTIPATPSNSIYIATSSIDGNVCVSSLVNPKDVQLRNFGRPVQAIALSPDYKNDRAYVSGGLAGSLVLTVGGRIGASTNSTLIGGSSANPSGWFGSLGLGSNTGKDTVLHSGEGAINAIKWSLSGKYVVWVNEEGIKIIRSNLHLESVDSEFAWKRMCHIDRPDRPGWEEMASVWKPRCEWVDDNAMDVEDGHTATSADDNRNIPHSNNDSKQKQMEKLVIGWGGTIWVIHVFAGGKGTGKNAGERTIGTVEVPTVLRLDCLISGISLYTPNLLLVLSYIVPSDEDKPRTKEAGSQRGIRHRQNGLEPELLLIDIETKEELSADTLTVRRFESLSASDYHLGVLPPTKAPVSAAQRGALETLGTGLWDATLYPTRLFSSAGSIRSTTSSGDKGSVAQVANSLHSVGLSSSDKEAREMVSASSTGIKIFIHSPYDCVIAVKRRLADRLAWLDAHEQFEEAWQLINQHPEAVTSSSREGGDSVSETANQYQGSLAEFFTDDVPSIQSTNTLAEKEKRRIGEQWLEQLIGKHDWEEAGRVCSKVLGTTPRWDHWLWIFVRNNKFDEIAPYIPTDISPPLPSLIYEVFLGHYVSRDRTKFKEFIDSWPTDIFDVQSVIAAIEDQLKSKVVAQGTGEWHILTNSLAKLYLSGGHYREALQCYIRLQDAEAAMSLIREYHLLDAIADDIPGLVLLRVSKAQLKSASISELEEASSEPIKLLVREAANGIVHTETVVSQLQAANKRLFLYFYLKALWRGEAASEPQEKAPRVRGRYQTDAADKLMADEGRALIDAFADTAVELFADYDRPLLLEFLKSSTSYSYSAASSICEVRHYTTELIYLLSKTGQTKRALSLILSDLQDVSQAIDFAKTQDDPDLWDDLLSYSMDKPDYIRSLLVEAGTSIDPIKLVRRIPSGLEIEGLREGLTKLIREHDIQASISNGVAKVLIGEVALRMETLRRGQRRGIKFDIAHHDPEEPSSDKQNSAQLHHADINGTMGNLDDKQETQSGHCGGCHNAFVEQEPEPLVGFACGHIFHLSHLHATETQASNPPDSAGSSPQDLYEETPVFTRSVGPKVTNARLLKEKIGEGCPICASKRDAEGVSGHDSVG